MSIKSLKLRRPMRKYAPGGVIGQSQPEENKFGNSMQKTAQVTGLVGTIRSGVNQVAEPIRYNAESDIDPNTGKYNHFGKVEALGVAGATLDPARAISDTFKDPNASSSEKWASMSTLLTGPVGAHVLAKKRYKRLESERANQIYKDKMQTWGGASENPYTMMPNGGQVQSNTVELEQGEPYMLPDGSIDSIPTSAPTHAQGGVPITLPVGTKVLGKKMTFNKKQFKQLGRQLERTQNKYDKALDSNPTGLAANTAKRMLQNIQTDYNKLFQEQGVDTGGQQFANGGKIIENDPDMALDIKTRPYTERTVYQQFTHPETGKPFYPVKPTIRNLKNSNVFELNQGVYGTYEPYLKGANKWDIDYEPSIKRTYGDVKGDVKFMEPTGYEKYVNGGMVEDPYEDMVEYGSGGWIQKAVNPAHKGYCTPMTKATCTPRRKAFAQTMKKHHGFHKGADGMLVPMEPRSGEIYQPVSEETTPLQRSVANTQTPIYKGSNSYNPNNAMYTMGALAPVLYNIGQGIRKPDQLNTRDYLNPYSNEVRQAMRNRRYNIQPELNQIDTDTATYYRQLKEGALNPSQYLGGMQMASVNKNRAQSSLLARKQNVESGYLADRAQMDMSLGRDIAQTKMSVKDINDRNSAARRNYMAAGMSQLGQFAQIKQQENNMMIRDAQKLKLLPALVQNFTLNQDGTWTFKKTGETMENPLEFIKGNNIR